jgi:acetate kinase
MDEHVLEAMMKVYFGFAYPVHRRAYVNAVRDFRKLLPSTPLLGLFETTFFRCMPDYAAVIPMPWEWARKHNIYKQVGHGASHRYVNERVAALMGVTPQEINTVQCHLGGTSSVAGVKAGVGFDAFGMPRSVGSTETYDFMVGYLVSRGEGTVEEVTEGLATKGGLSGISGMGFDFRDLEEAARKGHKRARLAIESYVYHGRRYLGGYFTVFGHVDAITMSGGTGERSAYVRKRILEGLEELGVVMDEAKNTAAIGTEARISKDDSKIQVWVIPTNEEIIIAREVYRLLSQS